MNIIKLLCNVKKCEYEFKEDSDHLNGTCIMQLCVRKVIFSTLFEHYALSFKWSEKEVIYEANDVGGYLVPSWYEGPPDPKHEWKLPGDCRFEIQCSPQQVNQTARNLTINGEVYILSKMNCKTWVSELVKKFKDDVEIVKSDSLLNLVGAPLSDLCYASDNLRKAGMNASVVSHNTGATAGCADLATDPRVQASSIAGVQAVPTAVTWYRFLTASSMTSAPIEKATEFGSSVLRKIRQVQFAFEDRKNYCVPTPQN